MLAFIAENGTSVASATILSTALCIALFLLRKRFPRLSGRSGDLKAIQSAHSRLTPRIGGLGIFAAFAVVLIAVAQADTGSSLIFVGAALLFSVGLAEDLGYGITPRKRMGAAALASVLVIILLGQWLNRTDIPFLDPGLQFLLPGASLTILLTVGIANGFNLIDGVNGLAALAGIVAALCLATIAAEVSLTPIVQMSVLLAAAIFGFFVVNYPLGLIFLGDSGAYTIGFVLCWFGIIIIGHAPEVSPWAILLTLFWPIADTLLAIYRRVRSKSHALAPDRMHTHQMVMRALEICWFGRDRRHISNPMTTLLLAPFVTAPPIVGVLFWDASLISFLAVIVFCVLFFASYVICGRLIARFRRPIAGEDKA